MRILHLARLLMLVALATATVMLTSALTPIASIAAAAPKSCRAETPEGPVFVTAACVDPELSDPYTDVDEERTVTDRETNTKYTYRYVHGGFTGTEARFAFFFPARDQYEGRFFQSTYPTVAREDSRPDTFALANGAYTVSTNNAGGLPAGGVLVGYRLNAAAAKYSRVVAAEVYGKDSGRPRGYLSGAKLGGVYQTISAMENTEGVWDGAVPMVPGVPNSIPSNMVVELMALRVLHDKLPQIVDALEPGGSGDPYAGLNAEERTALEEATRLGFPLHGWWQHATLTGGAFEAVFDALPSFDPTYVDDFWSKPGYEGSNPTSSVGAARIEGGPNDNSTVLAFQYYYRHQVPTPDMYAWNQFRDKQGDPIYPQRAELVGPTFAELAGGAIYNGEFTGKMIMLASLLDVEAFPWSADWYRTQAQAALGKNLDDNFRLWFMDNADHTPPKSTEANAHLVSYEGELQQALLDLDAWVKDGTPPAATTRYDVDADTQVGLPDAKAQRGGVQPAVTLTANGDESTTVAAGESVTFSALIKSPKGTGKIVAAEWDFDGTGTYAVTEELGTPKSSVRVKTTHAFAEPGTYFIALRVASQRDGDPDTPYARVQNLGRVRVVVVQ